MDNNHTHFRFAYHLSHIFPILAQCKSTYTSSYTQGGEEGNIRGEIDRKKTFPKIVIAFD